MMDRSREGTVMRKHNRPRTVRRRIKFEFSLKSG